jgi:Fuc2NAc and GlcNAc transferase
LPLAVQTHLWLLAVALIASLAGTAGYARIARRFGIVSVPNERTLHKGIIPRGGGIVVSAVVLASIAVLYLEGVLPERWFLALFVGGAVTVTVGFVDDVRSLSPVLRIVVHALVGLWATIWLGGISSIDLGVTALHLGWLRYALTVLGVMWMINLYNFMDGIDGMATSGAVFFCAAAAGLIEWQAGSVMSVLLAVLGVASIGFLVFNWSPARLFLGDSGSNFYGYAFAVIVLITVTSRQLSFWTWIILLGYFIGDTTTTMLIRIWTVPKWYGTHRGHCYQNLARVWQNHQRVTLMVSAIHVLWLLPLAIASVRWPHYQAALAVAALLPPIAMAVAYGPRYAR